MPRSVASYYSLTSDNDAPGDDDPDLLRHEAEALHNTQLNASQSLTGPSSPVLSRSTNNSRAWDADTRNKLFQRDALDETTPLLANERQDFVRSRRTSARGTPRATLSRQHSQLNTPRFRHHSRRGSFGVRLARALANDASQTELDALQVSKSSMSHDNRVWYDQFTSTDWLHDMIADAFRVKQLRSRRDWKGRLYASFDAAQGWIVVAIIGIFTALFAYLIDIVEATVFDFKEGYCRPHLYYSKRKCCSGASECHDWRKWSHFTHGRPDHFWFNYGAFTLWVILLSTLACMVTLQTRTTVSPALSLSTLDENLGAERHAPVGYTSGDGKDNADHSRLNNAAQRPPVTYYSAAGSGVAEVKVILSGFVLHGYLGVRTLAFKTIGLILSVASGLSIGKEGPYVHIATCIGNIACRLFPKYRDNDGKRREMLSAAAAAGVGVAFGSPIGGVLFSLEEVSYYFPPKTLFRTFCCSIVAALSLKFLNPYGTGKIVLFEVRYLLDWRLFELAIFVILGVLGGILGALFIKASRIWAKSFRKIAMIKNHPLLEVILVAIVTGAASFWNRYTRLPVAELLFELAAPCEAFSETGSTLCPTKERIPRVLGVLALAFVLKACLTVIAFGIKVPAGIYVPSMVVGGLVGRMVGHAVQLAALSFPEAVVFRGCPADGNPESCVVPGVYALVAAGATMCGVTRLSVTLAVILFELTGSLEHVLPFSLGVLTAKWTADALEPLSIYDLLTDMNSYPYLDAKARPVFTDNLGDITPRLNPARYVDLSIVSTVPARELRAKLNYLQMAGELDGAVPILRFGVLVGLIPAPDLEFALDRLDDEEHALCHMDPHHARMIGSYSSESLNGQRNDRAGDAERGSAPLDQHQPPNAGVSDDTTDLTPYIDSAPLVLDVNSSLDLVFECFVKLGLRYVCASSEGRFAGLVHKKEFVRLVKLELEKGH